jgi:hypothetical protein
LAMREFRITPLVEFTAILGAVNITSRKLQPPHPNTPWGEMAKMLDRHLAAIEADSKAWGLRASLATCGRIRAALATGKATYGMLEQPLIELQGRLRDEMTGTFFLVLEPDKTDYFSKPNLFGDQVAQNFPSAIVDIEEAGKCLALSRNTASVFHLMRALEAGLRALGASLGDPSLDANANPTWDRILKRGDAELLKSAANRSPEWRAKPEFFNDAIANLRAVKTAWRNPTMHVIGVYDDGKALDVFNAVKGFMRHIATELREVQEIPVRANAHPVWLNAPDELPPTY